LWYGFLSCVGGGGGGVWKAKKKGRRVENFYNKNKKPNSPVFTFKNKKGVSHKEKNSHPQPQKFQNCQTPPPPPPTHERNPYHNTA